MVKAKKWILMSQFEGEPKVSNFQLEEEDLPDPQDGEIICEAVYYSIDPYFRAVFVPVGSVMIGEQLARVIESRDPDYPVGCLVLMFCGWRSRTLVNPKEAPKFMNMRKVPDLGGRELSIALGVMGFSGLTAYYGLLENCEPKQGEVVLVNGAAGSVGSVAGQIAKIKGCKVIGFAGTEEKCDWIKSLGFDHVFNYKETDVDEALKQVAPGGIDCYFDNVGGHFTSKVLKHMKEYGRISVCGSISTYNDAEQPSLPFPFHTFIFKQLTVKGFLTPRWQSKFPEARAQILQWINDGKLKYKETVRQGFGKMPEAFIDMMKGENIGKMIVKAT